MTTLLLNTPLRLPLEEPVLIFSVVLFVILLSPIILSRFKIPGIIGLILAGVALGPKGLHILENDSSFRLFGFVGLLYIMFLAGLDLELSEFKKTRNNSIVFGLLTFLIPLGLGFAAFYWGMKFEPLPSLLIGSMFSTHTLVGYPIVSRLGLNKNVAVNTAVGGTILTDTAALLVLAVITQSVSGELSLGFWVETFVAMALFLTITLAGFPLVARWFFKNIKDDNTSHYIFVLAMVFMAAFLVGVAHMEPIVGAFIAGLALNKLIPNRSELHSKIEFVGSALFIPFFLISVGMLVDIRVLLAGQLTWIIIGVLVVVAMFSKWIAALLTQRIFGFSAHQRQLIFGLSSAHAAATLAIIKAGFDRGIIGIEVLNGAVVLILVSCLIAAIITENAGKKLVISERLAAPQKSELTEKILIPVENYLGMDYLVDFAHGICRNPKRFPLYALQITTPPGIDDSDLEITHRLMDKIVQRSHDQGERIIPLTRSDINKGSGVVHTINEEEISEVVIPWHERNLLSERIFGSDTEMLINSTHKTLWICRMIHPVETYKSIVVIYPENAEYEPGFTLWNQKIMLLAKKLGANINYYGPKNAYQHIIEQMDELDYPIIAHDELTDPMALTRLSQFTDKTHLIVTINARKGSLSYHSSMDQVGDTMYRFFRQSSFVLVYPEQNHGEAIAGSFKPEELDVTVIQENLGKVRKIFKTRNKA
ncbi:MAG TPA: cation:proton antiporter [Luteibaculaceae bacterium]|nr:cation:proton antiporter [Luteibaculaceae bacterium]